MPKVLLIEDDETMRGLLQTLLEIEGLSVVVDSGSDMHGLLDLIHREQPGVILLDYHLKTMSGLDVLRSIRADEQAHSVQVIMASGMDLREQCLQAGANDFILKPYNPEELVTHIRSRAS